jgi:hypothetical protein
MGIPTVERAVIQKDDKSSKYTLLVEGTGLQVREWPVISGGRTFVQEIFIDSTTTPFAQCMHA